MEVISNYYAVIPAKVRYSKKLKANEKLFYGEITALAQKNGCCWASNKYFADLYDVDIRTISRWINHLKEEKFIETEMLSKENNKLVLKRVIKIVDDPLDKNVYTPRQNCPPPLDKIVQENNTSISRCSSKEENKKEESLFELVERCMGRLLNSIEYETINSWEDNEANRYAIKLAGLNGAKSIRYIECIIQTYKHYGIKTLEDAKHHEESRRKQKEESPKPRERQSENRESNEIFEINGLKFKLDANGKRVFI